MRSLLRQGLRRPASLLAAAACAVTVGVVGAGPASAALPAGDPVRLTTARMAPMTALPRRAPATTAPRRRTPPPYTGRGFTLGDSVMKGAREQIAALNYTVDAVGSRQPSAGYSALVAYRNRLPGLVVIHMGTNGGITRAWFDKYMKLLGPDRRVVWVTLQLRNDYSRYTYEDSSNTMLRAAVKDYPNARLLDWNKLSERHRGDWLISDGIHLTFAGRTAFARLIDAVARP
jgi:hypothetical protein